MSTDTQSGVSIVICCHNSAKRLPQTLAHLKAQKVSARIPWEVLLVDNASTDGTAAAAAAIWGDFAGAPLRVTMEPELGLAYARVRGFNEARFELVSFVDDDNWVAGDWVETVFEVMAAHPQVGACGGRSEAVFETQPAAWFDRFSYAYAVGEQAEQDGAMGEKPLWGAGMCVRRSAYHNLIRLGYSPQLRGRAGKTQSAGEDTELCYALILTGWQLWYSKRLVLRHFMPGERMGWNTLRTMFRGFGAAQFVFSFYRYAIRNEISAFPIASFWLRQVLKRSLAILRYRFSSAGLKVGAYPEGDERTLTYERDWGYLHKLWAIHDGYAEMIHNIQKVQSASE